MELGLRRGRVTDIRLLKRQNGGPGRPCSANASYSWPRPPTTQSLQPVSHVIAWSSSQRTPRRWESPRTCRAAGLDDKDAEMNRLEENALFQPSRL
jgi:hypothetical protein